MPWPMVHFAISDQLHNGTPAPELLIGSIGPDAIHARGSISREEKGLTHLVYQGIMPTKEMIGDKYDSYVSMNTTKEWRDFVLGYFSHIYTDLRWTETLYSDFELAYGGEPNAQRGTYNSEVSQVEFDLIRSTDRLDKWIKLLKGTEGYSIDPYVTGQEVRQYRDEKIAWLLEAGNEPRITPVYFTLERVLQFIDQTAMEIRELLSERLPAIEEFIEERRVK
ncbi:hypothetical protein PCCS19_43490 [Paenibacillus sp. CCS19]|uniref:hypothetical protein n=1 Tax=Paenibacillus sp. CCS19 TaxID=3158387 RepID=UPI00256C8C28|nr:hypothetical protein [Paenibacillus cellulosilyticus]GMK41293.1 hypothetical protein PCCS19_43490 [Paenibacillus cellulosilyticus]